jgi:hypothetical protein
MSRESFFKNSAVLVWSVGYDIFIFRQSRASRWHVTCFVFYNQWYSYPSGSEFQAWTFTVIRKLFTILHLGLHSQVLSNFLQEITLNNPWTGSQAEFGLTFSSISVSSDTEFGLPLFLSPVLFLTQTPCNFHSQL